MSSRPSSLNRVDPELGLVRLCRTCGDEWPLDEEFWYFAIRHPGQVGRSHGRTYIRRTEHREPQAMCRACWADRSQRQHLARVASRRAA